VTEEISANCFWVSIRLERQKGKYLTSSLR